MLLASAGAGLVDAIVGGGGLIIVPSLFGLFPQAVPATLLGTNKAASIWGTGWSAWQYARQVRLPSARLLGAIMAAMLGGLIGAWLATLVPATRFRVALPVVLVAVWLYTLWRKDMGRHHLPHWRPRTEALLATAIGALIGFYDGIFGPGTGSFFVFALVRLLGWDFLHASAAAKRLNFATNVAALAWFIPHGHVVWALALPMAVANVAGSMVGTRLALRHGAGFVRVAFLVVVGALICKTSWDAYGLAG
ncbi:MAG TPA: TSUP family transporter [Aquabacterium sp.]|uniref:sulfite exporter TauE/SafE family protein n=1 Tax=Aquabacterium sp. TaxID=1872578 RepID=UPI002E2F351D|nr:TSUP family transporter [Aquabacterium sp.]HEX5372616.1 TSUP family transporter [Aquabacterium sp.]